MKSSVLSLISVGRQIKNKIQTFKESRNGIISFLSIFSSCTTARKLLSYIVAARIPFYTRNILTYHLLSTNVSQRGLDQNRQFYFYSFSDSLLLYGFDLVGATCPCSRLRIFASVLSMIDKNSMLLHPRNFQALFC